MHGTNSSPRFKSVSEYIEANGLKKGFVARRWGITPFEMTALLYPGRYYVRLDEEQIAAIAKDLNQPIADARKILEFALAS